MKTIGDRGGVVRPEIGTGRTRRGRPGDIRRRLLVVALAVSMTSLGACGAGDRAEVPADAAPLELFGERAGLMAWRSVAGTTSYRMEILDGKGRVTFTHTTPDTIAPLPPGFDPTEGTTWWVRAFDGSRVIAVSEKQIVH